MKKIYFILLLYLFPALLYAQTNSVDSIKQIINSKDSHDTTKAKSYLNLYEKLQKQFPDTIFYLGNTAINLLNKLTLSSTENKSKVRIQADIWFKMGERKRKLNKFEEALIYLENSSNSYFEINYLYLYHIAQMKIGVIHLTKGNYLLAETIFNTVFISAEKIADKSIMATAFNNMGNVYYETSNYIKAIEVHKKSLTLREEIKDTNGMISSLGNLALAYQESGYFKESFIYQNQGFELVKASNNKEGMAKTLGNMGGLFYLQGKSAEAMEYFKKSINIFESVNNKSGCAKNLNNIGIIYQNQGNYPKALENLQQSLKIKSEINDTKGVSISLLNIGLVYKLQNDLDSAINYYNRSLVIKETIGDIRGVAYVYNNLGIVYRQQKKFTVALAIQKKSQQLKTEINDKIGLCTTLNNIAELFGDIKDYKNSVRTNKIALASAKELKYTAEIQNAYYNLYKSYIRLGFIDSAYVELNNLILYRNLDLENNYFTLSENEKELYYATMESDFNIYNDFLIFHSDSFPGISDSAFNLTLRNKGLSLKSTTAMRSSILKSKDSLLITKYENWIVLKNKIAKLYADGEESKNLEDEANELEKILVKYSNTFSDYEKVKKLNWKKVQSTLKPNEVAIEFINFKSEIDTANPIIYAALIVKPEIEHPEVIKLCTEEELKSILGIISGTNQNFVNTVYGTRKEAQTALYNKVWKPLEVSLKDVKTVYYSPSGLLHKISFASLSKSENLFLCDNYQLNQMSSSGKVALGDDVIFNSEDNYFLMGGVNYDSDSTKEKIWNYLPGTLSETDGINKLLSKKKYTVEYLVKDAASEESLKQDISTAEIVHISSHGFFYPDPEQMNEEAKSNTTIVTAVKFRGSTNYANWSFVNNKNPLMRSGLVLAHANDVWNREALAEGEDGILTAQEVSNLDLSKTKLVVLSACETGLGDIKGSEGVFGLQRAFKMAGAKYIIMSLWQVPDEETAEFMKLFYKNLLKDKNIRTAFDKTQKTMRKKYDPFFWGAFVLIE